MYRNLLTELQKRRIQAIDVADCLGLPMARFLDKLQGRNDFTIEEAFGIKQFFFPDIALSYLFQRSDRNAPPGGQKKPPPKAGKSGEFHPLSHP